MTIGHSERTRAVTEQRRWATTTAADVLSSWAKGITAYAGDPSAPDPEGTIVFGAGIPDPPTLPREGLLAATRRVLQSDGPGALRYGSTQGDIQLRNWLAERLNRQEDAGVTAENFFLTNGSGQAIQMVVAAFANPGDVVLVERPSYPGGMRTLRAYGAQLIGIDMDEEGVSVDALETTLRRLSDEGRTPPFFYTMPNLHNPTGLTTTPSRRERVVDLCDEYGVLIVEDDAYGEVRVEGERPPSYFKLSGGQGALRLSTVSKMLAAGLRIGWVTGRKDFVDTLTRLRFDGGLSPFLTRIVAEFCTSGDQDRHLEMMVPIYREKRDRMLAALSERCSTHVSWIVPEGGYFLWLKLAPEIDPTRLSAAMTDEKVAARAGAAFFPDAPADNYLRLCFSNPSIEQIEEGVRRLGRALDRCAG